MSGKARGRKRSGGCGCGPGVVVMLVLGVAVLAYTTLLLPTLYMHTSTADHPSHNLLHPFFQQKTNVDRQGEAELLNRVHSLTQQVESASEEMDKIMALLQSPGDAPPSSQTHAPPKQAPVSQQAPHLTHSSFQPPHESKPKQQAPPPPPPPPPSSPSHVDHGAGNGKEPALRNPILKMTEAEFRSTPVDQMIERYLPGDCPGDFGMGLVNRWRGTAKTCCDGGGGEGASKLTCHLVHQTSHHGAGDQLLLAENVQVNFRDLVQVDNNGKIPRNLFTQYVKSRHNQQYSKVEWSKGTMTGMCTPQPANGWEKKYFPGWNANWFDGFKSINTAPQCDVWIETPTLIVERDTFANFFHNSEDFFNTFLSLAILRWPLKDLQILLTDIYPDGPFWPMWSKIFTGGKPPLMAYDIAQKYGNQNVCFKQLAVGILGAAAPITVASRDTKCKGTNLVRAYSDFVVRGLGLHHLNDPRPLDHVNVTYVARRSSSQWPERRFCDSERSYFDCSQLNHLETRKLGRTIKNDADVTKTLKALEKQSFKNGAHVHVRDVDFNLLSFEDQIAIDVTSDIMIGPHGAGLMHNIFMSDRATLLELFVDGSSANRHFHNLAFWAGHSYNGQTHRNPLDVRQLKQATEAAISNLDLSYR